MPNTAPTEPAPLFAVGDRVFSHYTMSWGTVERVQDTQPACPHGVTGELLPATTWYSVRADDDGGLDALDDAGGNWELARLVPPAIATRYGYGTDPRSGR